MFLHLETNLKSTRHGVLAEHHRWWFLYPPSSRFVRNERLEQIFSWKLLLVVFLMVTAVVEADEIQPRRIAGITSTYFQNAHADVILTRLLRTDSMDDQGRILPLRLTSLFTDQVDVDDLSRPYSKQFGFSIYDSISATLTQNTDRLAVDGVLFILEQGTYPMSPLGQTLYPKRRMFTEIVETFKRTGQVVPVFYDKHLSHNWEDAKWIYETAKKMQIPLIAGSSLPTTWRYPPEDVERGAELKEIVVLSFGGVEGYGFHALEVVQSLSERRKGGETGVQSVQAIEGAAVWEAGEQGVYDRQLLNEALSRLRHPPVSGERSLKDKVKHPLLFIVDYHDGLRANVLILSGAVGEWAAAWRNTEEQTRSALIASQHTKPYMHFAHLCQGIESMMLTGEPTWPVERTLLTSGMLEALLISLHDEGRRVETPWLDVRYESNWDWQQPSPWPVFTPETK